MRRPSAASFPSMTAASRGRATVASRDRGAARSQASKGSWGRRRGWPPVERLTRSSRSRASRGILRRSRRRPCPWARPSRPSRCSRRPLAALVRPAPARRPDSSGTGGPSAADRGRRSGRRSARRAVLGWRGRPGTPCRRGGRRDRTRSAARARSTTTGAWALPAAG